MITDYRCTGFPPQLRNPATFGTFGSRQIFGQIWWIQQNCSARGLLQLKITDVLNIDLYSAEFWL